MRSSSLGVLVALVTACAGGATEDAGARDDADPRDVGGRIGAGTRDGGAFDAVVIAHHARSLGSGLCSSLDCAALSYSCGYDGFGNSCGTCAAGETCNPSIDATSQHYSRCLPATCP